MTTIQTWHVKTYRDAVEHLVQQGMSRFRGAVDLEMTPPGTMHFWEQLAPTDDEEVTTRYGDTPFMPQDHRRRAVHMRTFDWSTLIDKVVDVPRMLVDPQSSYTINAAMTFGRRYDKLVIEAATGTALTGEGGLTSVSLPAGQQIAVDYTEGAATNTGMTVAKLREASRILYENEAVMPGEELFLALRAQQIKDLLQEDEVVNNDYNLKALQEGKVPYFMGFHIIRSELLAHNSTTDVDTCFAWARRGIKLGITRDMTIHFTPSHPGKRHNPQIYVETTAAATRMQEEKVVSILCDRSP